MYEKKKKELDCDLSYNNRVQIIQEQKKLLEKKKQLNVELNLSVIKHKTQIAMVYKDIQMFNGCLINKLQSINEEKRVMASKL